MQSYCSRNTRWGGLASQCWQVWSGLLLGCLACGPLSVSAQDTAWERYMAQGASAFQQAQEAEAERLYRAALDEVAQAGPEDPRLAVTLNTLAVLYHAQHHYARAERLYQRVLQLLEQAVGSEHPTLATTMNNLAVVREAQGKLDDAEPLYQRAIALIERTAGPAHPSLAAALDNYADLLRKMQREAEAEPLARRARAIWARQERPAAGQ